MTKIKKAIGSGMSELIYEYTAGCPRVWLADAPEKPKFTLSSVLSALITALATSLSLPVNTFAVGDIVRIDDELVLITGASTGSGPYVYPVKRCIDKTIAEEHKLGTKVNKVMIGAIIDDTAPAPGSDDSTIVLEADYAAVILKGDILRREVGKPSNERILVNSNTTGTLVTERNFTLEPSIKDNRAIAQAELLIVATRGFVDPEEAGGLDIWFEGETIDGVKITKDFATTPLKGDQRGVDGSLITEDQTNFEFTTPVLHPKWREKMIRNQPAVSNSKKVGINHKTTIGELAIPVMFFIKGKDEVEPIRHLIFAAEISSYPEITQNNEQQKGSFKFVCSNNKAMATNYIEYTDQSN